MFLWTTPFGAKTFKRPLDEMDSQKALAGEPGPVQRLPRRGPGVVARRRRTVRVPAPLFFLGCVVVAGLYGAATASRAILFIQALPAAAALVVTVLAR